MASQSQMPLRSDTGKNRCRPRFQFSLQALLWLITACAAASAVLGWIGPEWGLAFLLGLPQMVLWGVPLMWLARSSLRRYGATESFGRSILAVMWTGPLYVVVEGGVSIGFVVRHRLGIGSIGTIGPQFEFGEFVEGLIFYELILPLLLIFAAIATLVAASVFSVFVTLVLLPWGSRPFVFASLIGGGIGMTLPPLLYHVSLITADRQIFFHFIAVPTAMGIIVPPLLLVWVNRPGPRASGGAGSTENGASDRLR